MSTAAATAARNRRKGARWEGDLKEGLRNQGFDTERLKLTGKEDEGDLVVRLPSGLLAPRDRLIIEAKDAAMNVTDFIRQATVEADHYASHRSLDRGSVLAIAAVKRRGKNWREAVVLTTLGELLGMTL